MDCKKNLCFFVGYLYYYYVPTDLPWVPKLPILLRAAMGLLKRVFFASALKLSMTLWIKRSGWGCSRLRVQFRLSIRSEGAFPIPSLTDSGVGYPEYLRNWIDLRDLDSLDSLDT